MNRAFSEIFVLFPRIHITSDITYDHIQSPPITFNHLQYHRGVDTIEKSAYTSSRKREHMEICCANPIERGFSGFDDIRLVHNALPECDMDAIDTSVSFLGHNLSSPLFIAGMTGGHPDTTEVNMALANAAAHFNIGMGVGSQRAALENPELESSFTIVRDAAPKAFICGNQIGRASCRERVYDHV